MQTKLKVGDKYEQRVSKMAEVFAREMYPIVTDMEIDLMRPLAVIAVAEMGETFKEAARYANDHIEQFGKWMDGNAEMPVQIGITQHLVDLGYLPTELKEEGKNG